MWCGEVRSERLEGQSDHAGLPIVTELLWGGSCSQQYLCPSSSALAPSLPFIWDSGCGCRAVALLGLRPETLLSSRTHSHACTSLALISTGYMNCALVRGRLGTAGKELSLSLVSWANACSLTFQIEQKKESEWAND